MRKIAILTLLVLPMAAWADISGTTSISSGQSFNLDTGTAGTSGDFTWSGSSLTLQGGALGGAFPGGGGQSTYDVLTQSLIQQVAVLFSSAPIPTSADAVIVFKSRGGNFAKILVTLQSGSSLTFKYTTYGVSSGGGPTAPTISFVK